MSSPPDEEHCKECINAPLYCLKCEEFICSNCFSSSHNRPKWKNHVCVDAQEFKKIKKELDFIPTNRDYEADTENTFIWFNAEARKLELHQKYYTVQAVEEERLPIVSFIGSSGVGKSTLMRMIIKDGNPKPIPGISKVDDPTSSDIHAYLADLSNFGGPTRVLLCDSEGKYGRIPISSKFKSLYNRESELEKLRGQYVGAAYPRLLYMFSDAICLVSTASRRAIQELINELMMFGGLVAAGLVNQPKPPALILIFNKRAKNEGQWDVDALLRQFQIPVEFKSYFREIRIIDIPEICHLSIFIEQVRKLGEQISMQLHDTTSFNTKKATFEFLRIAVSKFSKNPKAPLDFAKLVMLSLPPPETFTGFLIAFFEFKFRRYERAYGVHDGFKSAVEDLAERIYPAFHKHVLRQGGPSMTRIPSELFDILMKVSQEVALHQPCQAKESFMGVLVQCSASKRYHANTHQCTSTYKTRVSMEGILGWIGLKSEVKQACRWEGPYLDSGLNFYDILCKGVEESFAKFHNMPSTDFFSYHYSIVRKKATNKLECSRVCLACLLQIPTERLECGHLVCAICCTEQQPKNSTINCPLCYNLCMWDHPILPDGIGYRILSIDGGGIRGLLTCMILEQVTTNLKIPIGHLFDLVIGSGSGGVVALGIGEKKTPKELFTLFQKIATTYRSVKPNHFTYYKYPQHQLYEEIANFFPENPMLGIYSPRIAVVGGNIDGKISVNLFTSYVPASNPCKVLRESDGSVRDVACTFGAGCYFPVAETKTTVAIDGACDCNNPCDVGYQEAEAIWPGRQLELLCSLGTGEWTDRDKANNNHILKFPFFVTDINKQNNEEWEQFLKQSDHNTTFAFSSGDCFRINPSFNSPFAMDDFKKADAFITLVQQYIKDNSKIIEFVSNRLLAKMFYLVRKSAILDDRGFQGTIKTREPIPHFNTPFFTARTFQYDKEIPTIMNKPRLIDNEIEISFTFNEKFTGSARILVFCHINYDLSIQDQGFLISGCPWDGTAT